MRAFEDIKLPPSQIEQLKSHGWGDKWVADAILQSQAEAWIAKYLKKLRKKCVYAQPRACQNTGREVYARKDGLPISQADYDAVAALDMGQENRVEGNPGDMEITHVWLCDSGD